MSVKELRSYRFASAAHWSRCLLHRFDAGEDGTVSPSMRLGLHPTQLATPRPLSAVAADPYGMPLFRNGDDAARLFRLDNAGTIEGAFETDLTLAATPRLVVGRTWAWAFSTTALVVRRYHRDSLQLEAALDVSRACIDGDRVPAPQAIHDAASDGRDGIWLLVTTFNGGAGLLRIDCAGRLREQRDLTCQELQPSQIGSVNGGADVVLLAGDGTRVAFVDASNGAVARIVQAADLAPCWRVIRMATDAGNRVVLWGLDRDRPRPGALFVLDRSGDTVDGPLASDGRDFAVTDLAVSRNTVWFATPTGLWRLDGGEASGARESDSTLLTPALVSPESDTDRGWLRAEITAPLPRGAMLDVQFASTNDPRLARELIEVSANQSMTAQARQAQIWSSLEQRDARRFIITGPTPERLPIVVPLFDSKDRWLWLRLHVVTPPGAAPAPIAELRVLYPELSIVRYLPAVFRGDANDPNNLLRRLVGVLEATTQRIDRQILEIAAHLDPDTAPREWVDYLARWLDLPWDDGLPLGSRRCILRHAADLIDLRGTRRGLERLLRALLGADGVARVTDVTVEHPPVRIGQRGAALPMVLAGAPGTTATLGAKAVVGRARLSCAPGECDPLASLVPALRIVNMASQSARLELQPLLARVLAQYVPAGIRLSIRWQLVPETAASAEDALVLEGDGPGALGADSHLGRTVLAGRGAGRIDEAGFDIGVRLT